MNFLHERISNKPTESNVELATSTPRLATLVFDTSMETGVPTPSRDIQIENSLPRKTIKRKPSAEQNNDDEFFKRMSLLDEKVISSMNETKCEATSFCQSLVPVLQSFDKKTLRKAKVKINQLLYDIEFCNE